MAIKIGSQVFIRTTEEPAFLLDIREGNAAQKFPGLSGRVAVVRRPTAGENGVRHEIEYFAVEEVESIEDNQNRKVSEMAELKARFQSRAEDNEPVTAERKLSQLD